MNEPAKPPAPAPSAERRDITIEALSGLYAAGRIELEEFEARVDRVLHAQTLAELDAVVDDLRPRSDATALAKPNPPEFAVDQPRRHASRLTVAVMGGLHRKGRWMPARRHWTLALMGGAMLDFREAVLRPGPTDVYLFTMWGGVEVAVPPGLDVEVTGGALMGGLERVSQESGSTDPRRPRLFIHAFAFMGGIEVKVRREGEPYQDQPKDG